MKKLWWFIKSLLGFSSVKDGSLCWFSQRWFDIHDYHKYRGGDGYPSHMYEYKCHKCGHKFLI